MEDYQTIQWQAEEAVGGIYLTATFVLSGNLPNARSIAAHFSYTNAENDVYKISIPLDGSHIQFQYCFHNRMELKGTLWIVCFNEGSQIAAVGISSNLSFGCKHDPSSRIFCQGVIATFPPTPVPPAPVPPLPPEGPSEVIVEPGLQEVANAFPYIFLRKWEQGCGNSCCTVSYLPSGAPTEATLYEHLVQATPHTWQRLQHIVDQYLSGALQTQYPCLNNINELQGYSAKFYQVYQDLRRQPPRENPRDQVLALLETSEEQLIAYLGSSVYVQDKEQCWQNYFALLIKLGYRMDLLEQLAETLLGAFVIEWLFLPQSASLIPADFKRHLNAAILLPSALFPLPALVNSQQGQLVVDSCKGTVQPFAVGELQLLRIKHARYQPGELARVVNVLAGEKKRHSRRQRERTEQIEEEKHLSSTSRGSTSNAEISQLFRQTLESIASKNLEASYNGLTVSYGTPATATLGGSWSEQLSAGSTPGERNLQRMGYELADRSRTELSRQVELQRMQRILRETEESDTSIIDNSDGKENRTYIYRWLDRICSGQLYHSGLRFVARFSIPRPAQGFTWTGEQNRGWPKSLRELGISDSEQITTQNYARLLGAYEITEELAPPATPRIVSAILRLNECKEISLPEGYQAVSATVTPTSVLTPAPSVNGAVGKAQFSFPPQQPVTLSMAKEEQVVPVIMMGAGIPGGQQALYPANEFAASVEIECQPSPALIQEWQSRVYRALVRAFEEQLKRYRTENGLEGMSSGRLHRNPAYLRAIQQQELRRRCVGVLQGINLEPDALDSPAYPVPAGIAEDFALIDAGFFNELFQWDLMTYRYLSSSWNCDSWQVEDNNPLQEDLSFAQFLRAESAIVLVPAQPCHALAALYYLRSGMIWSGPDHLVPVNPGDSDLVCELKSMGEAPCIRPIGKPWDIAVPTPEQVVVTQLDC